MSHGSDIHVGVCRRDLCLTCLESDVPGYTNHGRFMCSSCLADLDMSVLLKRCKAEVSAASTNTVAAIQEVNVLATRAALAESELAAMQAQGLYSGHDKSKGIPAAGASTRSSDQQRAFLSGRR